MRGKYARQKRCRAKQLAIEQAALQETNRRNEAARRAELGVQLNAATERIRAATEKLDSLLNRDIGEIEMFSSQREALLWVVNDLEDHNVQARQLLRAAGRAFIDQIKCQGLPRRYHSLLWEGAWIPSELLSFFGELGIVKLNRKRSALQDWVRSSRDIQEQGRT